MAEAISSIIAKLAEYLVVPTLGQVQYLFCIGKITKNVETRKEELIFKQERVQKRVEEAINKTERIDDEVNKWRDEVNNLIAEVRKLEEELRANPSCFQRWFPSWRRYCLCKQLAKSTQRMIELNSTSDKLEPFSHLIPIPGIEYHSSKNFLYFESTKKAFDQLWEALQDNGSFMIGLFGMGGSGKTTLAKKVGTEAKELKLFDRVLFTTVSQTPNIRKIQGEIADSLGLQLHEESENGRAGRIALRLQSGERILIILDDVWAKLKSLKDIGIPFEGKHQGSCKVLLTTRRQEVCTLMDCQMKIPLHLLTEDEAWILFQNHANIDDNAREVVARKIAQECKGLPIAIVAVGTCLKGKGLDEMNDVLDNLRQSKPINVDEGVRDAFACLKLSYDYLRIAEAKSLFLVCAMFPEDHKIIIVDVLRYAVGLGLCRGADSLEIARRRVRIAINILIDSSLLMYYKDLFGKEWLTMHDMVRDAALQIAAEEDHTIMINGHAKEPNELLKDESIKNCYAISLWYNNEEVHQFPCQLDAPKLEILLLNPRNLLDLSSVSFEGIKELKVMAIIKDGVLNNLMGSMPQSMLWLSNLRTLRLRGLELGDISYVVTLIRLEILDLQGCKFQKLPNGIERLNKLKLLDLSGCNGYKCCYKEIGRCSQLEELYVSRDNIQPFGHKCYHECLAGVDVFPKLRRYILQMGNYSTYYSYFLNECTRALCLGGLNISTLSEVTKDLAQRANAIEFYKLHGGCKSFFPDIIQVVGGMNELTKLMLYRCSEIECLTYKTTPYEDAIVPSLVELVLEYMDNLKQLCLGPPLLSLFRNLESLRIIRCSMLTSLFPVSVTCALLSLRHLTIMSCSELKHVIEGESGADAGEERSTNDQNNTHIMFPLLENLELDYLPNLLRICPKSYYPSWPSLKEVYWRSCPKLSTSCDSLMIGSEIRQPHPNMVCIFFFSFLCLHLIGKEYYK